MVRYIEIPKPVHCPKWGIDICLLGKYYLSDDMDSSTGKFKSASCPIVENSKFTCISRRQSINCSDALNICNVRC